MTRRYWQEKPAAAWHARLSVWAARRQMLLNIKRLSRYDFDPEPAEPNISTLGRGQQPDRGDPEILEDLSTKSDLAPLLGAGDLRAGRAGMRDRMGRHAGGPIAQKHDD